MTVPDGSSTREMKSLLAEITHGCRNTHGCRRTLGNSRLTFLMRTDEVVGKAVAAMLDPRTGSSGRRGNRDGVVELGA
jgi:hypothetical protein